MPSKKKSGVSRKGAVKLPSASVPTCFAASSSCDKELNEAIAASKALAFQKDTYEVALAQALQTSRATAEAEAEEAEQLRLAVEESLAMEERKSLGLGLKRKDQLIMHAQQATSDLCSRHISSKSWEMDDEKQLSTAFHLPSMPALEVFEANLGNTSIGAEDEAPSYVLKVTCRQDTRRLRTQWSPSTPSSEVLSIIWAAIEEGFDLQRGSLPAYTLRYPDDEGDLCTLAEGTVQDFLSMASKGKSFKLVLEEPSSTYAHKINTEVSKVEAGEPLGEFCIATPPTTPRNGTDVSDEAIEDDYDSAWSLVDLAPDNNASP